MLQRVVCASNYFARHGVRQNVNFLLAKRNDSTVAVAQSVQDEWESAKPFEDIPGPKPLPLIGNVWRFLPYIGNQEYDLLQNYNELYEKYGEIYKITGLPGVNKLVFLFNPSEMEKVFRHEGPWPIRSVIEPLKYYRLVTRKDFYEGIGGTGVTQGQEWQSFRSKVNPILMQPRATRMYVTPIDEVANDFVKRLRTIRDEKLEMPANFIQELHKWALESIIHIALDTRMGCLENDLKADSEPQKMIEAISFIFDKSFGMMLNPIWKYISTPTWRKFVKASDLCNEISMKYINEAMKRLKNVSDDGRELTILEKLLMRDSNPKTAIVMALDMFSGGVETTSYSTAVALYFLARNPEKQEKLFEEIHLHLPDKNGHLTSDILNEMKYLKACIKESMRLAPIVAANSRTLPKDMVLAGYRVPKGTDIVIVNLALCRREMHFREPKKFIPERWLKQDEQKRPEAKNAHPFVFMPFGFGPRMCLGKRFAELEIEIVLTRIIQNFRVEYNYGEVKFESKLLHVPVSPLKFKFVERG